MREREDEELWGRALRRLIRLLDLIIAKLEHESATTLKLTIEGEPMANFQLNALDSVVVTITDTDDVTGDAVTPDSGSVTAVLSNPNDFVVVDPTGAFLTITAAGATSTGNTVTVNATVNGVPSGPEGGAVGTYDVVADVVPPPDSNTITLTFGDEVAPSGVAASSVPEVDLGQETTANRVNGLE